LPDQDHYKHNAKRCFTLLQFGAASGGGRSSAGPAIIIIMMMIMMSTMMMGIGEESTQQTSRKTTVDVAAFRCPEQPVAQPRTSCVVPSCRLSLQRPGLGLLYSAVFCLVWILLPFLLS